MKYIFGSGIVGLLARALLGPEWKIIPFYKSRFFSFNPALDDNFILKSDKIEPFLLDLLGPSIKNYHMYARYYSLSGELFKTPNPNLLDAWLDKIFGVDVPPHSKPYLGDRLSEFIYNIRVNTLYSDLLSRFGSEIAEQHKLGMVTHIGDHHFEINGRKFEFDQIISTIPLDALYDLMGIQHTLSALNISFLHIQTGDLNLEGANQVWVADTEIDFFKVTNVAKDRYLFYFLKELDDPGIYMMQFMQSFDILDGTTVERAIPVGIMPDISRLESKGIHCVGSCAQWDWCMDIASCINRLLKFSATSD